MAGQEKKVIVGMSGGVDSAAAAALLLEAGYSVTGVTLQLWQAPSVPPTEDTAEDARAIAAALGIPLVTVDLRERFYQQVVQRFVDDYANGKTPNPCVTCNPTLKFEALLEAADQAGARWIATGHYARVKQQPAAADRPAAAELWRAASYRRDQSYMLYRLTQRHLTRLLLPLGDIQDKARVRALARQWKLPSAEQPDSQDLCFLRGGDYRTLLERMAAEHLKPGPILDESGKRLGEHRGLPRYTIGQRSGLGIAANERLYVLALDHERNALIVGPAERLERSSCTLEAVTFVAETPPAQEFPAAVRIRYRAPLVPATITLLTGNRAQVALTIPQRGIAPGQSTVFYQDDQVLGGGIIAGPTRKP